MAAQNINWFILLTWILLGFSVYIMIDLMFPPAMIKGKCRKTAPTARSRMKDKFDGTDAGNSEFMETTNSSLSFLDWPIDRKEFLPNFFTHQGRKTNVSAYRTSNIVFLHHNKAGGTTMRKILTNFSSEFGMKKLLVSSGNTGSIRNLQRKGATEEMFANRSLIEGDYSFGSCDFVNSKRPCSYFTMLREPIERVISSFFYCQQTNDQLCGPISARNMTVDKWAMHQGSYFFRQLLVHPDMCLMFEYVSLYQKRTTDIYTYFQNKKPSCWFIEKAYLQEKLTEKERQILLDYSINNLERWFAAIGILEKFDLSLKMFETVYNLPFTNFLQTQANRGALAAYKDKEHVKDLTLQLRKNKSVLYELRADLLLYAKATEIFEKQTAILKNLERDSDGEI